MEKVKDYNYETDIILNPDPIYGIGQKVSAHEWPYKLKVQSVCWSALKKSWVYTLEFVSDSKFSVEDILEKNLKPS